MKLDLLLLFLLLLLILLEKEKICIRFFTLAVVVLLFTYDLKL